MISQASKERLAAWWAHESLDRPCILASAPRSGAVVPEEPTPDEYWLNPECLAGQVFQRVENLRYMGEAQPCLYIDYGACALGLQMGAKGRWTSLETIWTDPCVQSADEVVGLYPGGEWKRIQDAAIDPGMRSHRANCSADGIWAPGHSTAV